MPDAHAAASRGGCRRDPTYRDVVGEVATFLEQRVAACRAVGIAPERMLLDPGIGFGKTVRHNLELLRNLPALSPEGLPILVGASRKSTIGHLTNKPPGGRLAGSIGAAVFAVTHGAAMVRVHDVEETVDALRVVQAIKEAADGRCDEGMRRPTGPKFIARRGTGGQ